MSRQWTLPLLDELILPEKGAIKIGPFGSALKKHEYSEAGIRVLGIEDVMPNQLTGNKPKFIPQAKYEQLTQYTVKAGDVLVTNMGTVGRACVVPPDLETSIISSHLIKVSLDEDKVYPPYVCWALNCAPSVVAQIVADSHGAIMAGFNSGLLRNLRIPLPSLSEQRRIAEVLDRAEALRAKRRAALALLDALTQSIFLEMFGDPVANPMGWPEGRHLGDVADIVSGITKGRKLNGAATRKVPYLAVVNVQDRRLDLTTVKTIESTETEVERYRLRKGDLVLTEGGDPDKLGRGALWAEELPECIHQNHIFRVRLVDADLTPVYLNWLVGSQRGKRYFLKSAKQTTGIATINSQQLRAFPLLIPPVSLQKEFAATIDRVAVVREQMKASLQSLDACFASLQHRAFRGEL